MLRRTAEQVATSWYKLPFQVRDAIGALVLLVISLLPLGIPALKLGELHPSVPAIVGVPLTVLEVAPLALRRVMPTVALAIVGAAFVAIEITGASTGLGGLAVLVALYTVAAHQRRNRMLTAGAAAIVYAALCIVLHLAGSPERLLDWFTFAGVLALPWALGEAMRWRNAAHAERVQRAAEDAVRAHRAVLARELHDVVTHHVTAMVVQSESAQYLDHADTAERDRVFAAVGETGRLALTELRTLLDTLDPETLPGDATMSPPGYDIVAMVGRLQDAGYPINLDAPAEARLPDDDRAVALTSVAREALTNAMKHARGELVSVRLRVSPLELLVTNPLPTGNGGSASSGGRGLAGMARRVEEAGGVFEAGPHGRSKFVVSVRWGS